MTSRSEDPAMSDTPDAPAADSTTARELELVVPYSGEVVRLDAPTDALAEIVYGIRELESELRSMKAILSEEVHRRMDEEARWTVEAGRFKVSGRGAGVTTAGPRLWKVLEDLVEAGRITRRAAEAAVALEVAYKVRVAGVQAVKRVGPDVAEAVAAAEIPLDPSSRRLTVSVVR
jgi:hypothetical protein